ncbi:hypothetical protein BV25DRAFT_1915085 [Artomyces pyxidatus]|uniref:Uncharacterized protein n=1 Tax=Artomyces pyxidatus TaxID=48021 RepID=A0ACB8T623_9AGAM|nr:hypothetical protein BV25DRAFT_1915085 [Artomyces pyxidatus]
MKFSAVLVALSSASFAIAAPITLYNGVGCLADVGPMPEFEPEAPLQTQDGSIKASAVYVFGESSVSDIDAGGGVTAVGKRSFFLNGAEIRAT